uniref:DHH family protein n=1 Tax=viral metagenome TaxID=1070528 RepID=A0A6M3J4F5_9ZZZZ
MKAFYHSADLDGHCSGALVKLNYEKCEMIGINYGDPFPWESLVYSEEIYMVDFCLQPFSEMIELSSVSDLVWIDHHKTAIENYEKYINEDRRPIRGLRRDGIGACQLVWEYLTKNSLVGREPKVPTFVKLLAEYDVWNHSDPRALPFQYGMRHQKDTSPEKIELWSSLFDTERVQQITEVGGIILEYQDSQNAKYVKSCAFETELDGLKLIAINLMLTNSKIFDSVWNQEKYDGMLTFGWRKGRWTVSLYTDKPGVDMSVIAKNRGGGGHVGAAGFQCDELPFNLNP